MNSKGNGGLVISRRSGDSFSIGDDILIVIKDIDYRKKNVRIFVKAPKDKKILRHDRISSVVKSDPENQK